MVAYVTVVPAASHNHIKITAKIQNNHHAEPPETQLNRSPTTRGLKKHQDW